MIAYLSIGSNIRPSKNIPACLKKLKENFRVRRTSSIYETSPVGPVGKKKFWNLAVQIETSFSKPEFLRRLRAIEKALGRRRTTNRFAPRPIDIDLILFRNWRRPGFEKLAFVLIPLAEIAPRLKPEGFKDPLGKLARAFPDPRQKVRKIRQGPSRSQKT